MKSLSFMVISKEVWAQPRRARKQLLYEAMLQQKLSDEIFYLDPPRYFWQQRSERPQMPAGMRLWQAILMVPGERFRLVRQLNRWIVSLELNRHMNGNKAWCSVVYHPWDVDLIPYLKRHGPVLFDWTEDWSVFHNSKRMGSAQEECIQSATAVVAVTKSLAERAAELRGSARDVLLLPNATSLPLLDHAPGLSLPDDISHIPEPRIGYAGHVGPWLDIELVLEVARRRPDWHWVLVGYADPSMVARFARVENVHLIGEKPLDQLQGYLAHCQVLAAPYRQGIRGDASKLYDYLTVGRPIVSSEIETAERLIDWLHVAQTSDDWIQCIDAAMCERGDAGSTGRREAVEQNSWPARARLLVQWLRERWV